MLTDAKGPDVLLSAYFGVEQQKLWSRMCYMPRPTFSCCPSRHIALQKNATTKRCRLLRCCMFCLSLDVLFSVYHQRERSQSQQVRSGIEGPSASQTIPHFLACWGPYSFLSLSSVVIYKSEKNVCSITPTAWNSSWNSTRFKKTFALRKISRGIHSKFS